MTAMRFINWPVNNYMLISNAESGYLISGGY
jgi:hypothetical protein